MRIIYFWSISCPLSWFWFLSPGAGWKRGWGGLQSFSTQGKRLLSWVCSYFLFSVLKTGRGGQEEKIELGIQLPDWLHLQRDINIVPVSLLIFRLFQGCQAKLKCSATEMKLKYQGHYGRREGSPKIEFFRLTNYLMGRNLQHLCSHFLRSSASVVRFQSAQYGISSVESPMITENITATIMKLMMLNRNRSNLFRTEIYGSMEWKLYIFKEGSIFWDTLPRNSPDHRTAKFKSFVSRHPSAFHISSS